MLLQADGVLFDFDYTLADSSSGVVECVAHALRAMRLRPVSPEAVRATIGLSLPDTLAALAGLRDAGQAETFVRLFVAHADEIMTDRTVMFEDAASTLRALRALGLKLGVVSTKYRYRIEQALQREGLAWLPQTIVGGEDVTRHKPDPQPLLLALERLGLPADRAVYVGDSMVDAQATRGAGVRFVGVTTGHASREALLAEGAVAVIDRLQALLDLVSVRGRA